MDLTFREIELSDAPLYEKYWSARKYDNSELTFGNIFIWRNSYQVKMAVGSEALYLMAQYEGKTYLLCPLLLENADMRVVISEIRQYFQSVAQPFELRCVPEAIKEKIQAETQDKIKFHHWCWQDDYVYNREDLVNLAGRKYHAKRNHISQFMSKYSYEVVPIQGKDIIIQCLAMADRWLEKAQQNEGGAPASLIDERQAIGLAFEHIDALKLHGVAIMIDGQVEAFSLGQQLIEGMELVHFEKANGDFQGLYAMINQTYAKNLPEDIQYINREEDLGIPGLRRAKKSYNPVYMVKKYTAICKGDD